MKRAVIFFGVAVSVALAGCKPQVAGLRAAKADGISDFKPLPASTAKPVKSSIPALASFKPVGDLTVPFYNDQPSRLTFSPDGKWGAAPSRTYNGDILLWNLRTRVLTKRLKPSQSPHRAFENLAWSPDSKKLAAWTDASFLPAPLVVWDVASEEVQDSIENGELTAISACFLADGRLLVSWANNRDSKANDSHVSIEQDGQRKDLDVGMRGIVGFFSRRDKSPLALILTPTGVTNGVETMVRTSICEWENDHFGEPLIEFDAREAMFTMTFSSDEKIVALSGVRQSKQSRIDSTPLYVVCDLEKRQILWRVQPKQWSVNLSLSPDGGQLWAEIIPTLEYDGYDARTGTLTHTETGNMPYFSPDGQRAVQLVTENRGQKPFLATFRLFERLTASQLNPSSSASAAN